VLVDASEPLTEQDVRLVTMVVDAGRALVLACNKWDLMDDERRRYLERELERDSILGSMVNISASRSRR
jgi:GTP-binding protein